MKAFFKAALLALALPVVAIANQFEEGVHYEVIADEATADPEIKEFFSFYCVHCFRFGSAGTEVDGQGGREEGVG